MLESLLVIAYWPGLLVLIVLDFVWFSFVANAIVGPRDEYQEPPVFQLFLSIAGFFGILFLFGLLKQFVSVVRDNLPYVIVGVVAYLILGLVYVYFYRMRKKAQDYLDGTEEELARYKERWYREQKNLTDLEKEGAWQEAKKEWLEERRIDVKKHVGWLALQSLFWGPDFLYRVGFRLWIDLAETFWRRMSDHLQKKFDNAYDKVGKDV